LLCFSLPILLQSDLFGEVFEDPIPDELFSDPELNAGDWEGVEDWAFEEGIDWSEGAMAEGAWGEGGEGIDAGGDGEGIDEDIIGDIFGGDTPIDDGSGGGDAGGDDITWVDENPIDWGGAGNIDAGGDDPGGDTPVDEGDGNVPDFDPEPTP
jgi:hypothetical protein